MFECGSIKHPGKKEDLMPEEQRQQPMLLDLLIHSDPQSDVRPFDTTIDWEWEKVSQSVNLGFTLAEVKAAGIGVKFARSIGIAVDHRRRNRNQESFELNKARLQNYINKLVLFPRDEKNPVTKAKKGILNDTPKENQKVDNSVKVNVLPPLVKRVKAVGQLQLDQLRKGNAYKTLRQEWANQRNEGRRLKKEKEAAEKNWLDI